MIRKAGEILRELMKTKGWPLEDPSGTIFSSWKSVAGEPAAGHSKPVEIEDGVLLVDVDHPGWKQVLLLDKASLLQRARAAAPGAHIKDIRLRVKGAYLNAGADASS